MIKNVLIKSGKAAATLERISQTFTLLQYDFEFLEIERSGVVRLTNVTPPRWWFNVCVENEADVRDKGHGRIVDGDFCLFYLFNRNI